MSAPTQKQPRPIMPSAPYQLPKFALDALAEIRQRRANARAQVPPQIPQQPPGGEVSAQIPEEVEHVDGETHRAETVQPQHQAGTAAAGQAVRAGDDLGEDFHAQENLVREDAPVDAAAQPDAALHSRNDGIRLAPPVLAPEPSAPPRQRTSAFQERPDQGVIAPRANPARRMRPIGRHRLLPRSTRTLHWLPLRVLRIFPRWNPATTSTAFPRLYGRRRMRYVL